MERTRGRIAVIQEGRFGLDPGDGRLMHFTLSPGNSVEPQDLVHYQDGEVVVTHQRASGVRTRIAHRLTRYAP